MTKLFPNFLEVNYLLLITLYRIIAGGGMGGGMNQNFAQDTMVRISCKNACTYVT